ncbi:MAG: tryptophan--tRNA ligase, partial [Firmicutes bacterium]|nr:tryptophan--tRNA ligase [Bacillota bacterium]
MSEKQRVLSGMRPTGVLHLGHQRVIEYWSQLSEDYDAYFFTADWHAITTQ